MTSHRARLRRVLVGTGAVVAAAVLYAVWPRRPDLRDFEPAVVARLETEMWRAYYGERNVDLARALYRLSRREYGFSPLDSVLLAFHAGRAATRFRPTRSRGEAEVALPELERYFHVVARGTVAELDVAAAAREELDWWQQRREDRTWQEYAQPVARVTALLYAVPIDRVREFALARCEAMDDRDRHGDGITEADWQRIEATLRRAWTSLHDAVGAQRD
jgi:hypothetical protein